MIREQGNISFKYRVLQSGEDEIVLFIERPDLKGRDFGRQSPPPATLMIAGETFNAATQYRTDNTRLSNGLILVVPKGLDRKRLIEAVQRGPVATVEFDGQSYSLDLSGFERAAVLGS